MIKVRLILFLLLTIPIVGFSQNEDQQEKTRGDFGLEADLHYGFLIAHRGDIRHLQKGHTFGFELALMKQTNGSKDWQRIYLNPEYGVSYLYYQLGNREQLGNAHALVFFGNLPLIHNKRNIFQVRVGLGPGFVERSFDSDENNKNIAIGSRLNLVSHFKLGMQKLLFKRTWINSNIGLTHWSNGSIRVPNLGINVATLGAGVKHYIGEGDLINRSPVSLHKDHWKKRISIGASVKEIYPPEGKLYPIATLGINGGRQFTHKSFAGLGLDIFYNPANIDRIEREDPAYSEKTVDQFRSGIHVAYELKISAVSILLNVGTYIHNPYPDDGNIYNKYGIRYALNRDLDVFWKLKTHYARADFMEWGVEFNLR